MAEGLHPPQLNKAVIVPLLTSGTLNVVVESAAVAPVSIVYVGVAGASARTSTPAYVLRKSNVGVAGCVKSEANDNFWPNRMVPDPLRVVAAPTRRSMEFSANDKRAFTCKT